MPSMLNRARNMLKGAIDNMKKIMFCFAILALAVASASTHRVTLFESSVVGGTELKPGEYKLVLTDNKVVISQGKTSVEAQVKVEDTGTKVNSTSVRYMNGDGKYKIQEIRLGGTTTKLVFN
jgi:hypothetical protein